MPSKRESLQRIAANARIKPALESWVMALLSEAYDAGRANAEEGADVWYQVEYMPKGQNVWCTRSARTFKGPEVAREQLSMIRRRQQDLGLHRKYRIVRKVLTTRPVDAEVKP